MTTSEDQNVSRDHARSDDGGDECREAPSRLPTVELVDGAYYWVKLRYEDPDRWAIARWEHGCFWGSSGNEVTPGVISGPIPRPPAAQPPGEG